MGRPCREGIIGILIGIHLSAAPIFRFERHDFEEQRATYQWREEGKIVILTQIN